MSLTRKNRNILLILLGVILIMGLGILSVGYILRTIFIAMISHGTEPITDPPQIQAITGIKLPPGTKITLAEAAYDNGVLWETWVWQTNTPPVTLSMLNTFTGFTPRGPEPQVQGVTPGQFKIEYVEKMAQTKFSSPVLVLAERWGNGSWHVEAMSVQSGTEYYTLITAYSYKHLPAKTSAGIVTVSPKPKHLWPQPTPDDE